MANNNSLQTLQQTNRLDFLFTAGFEMFSAVPSLSRYYMNEFQHTLNEFELTAQKNIERLACKSCGQISVPGLSSRVEIVQKKAEKKRKQRKNKIQTTCLTCSRITLYHGSYKKKLPQPLSDTPAVEPVAPIMDSKKKKNKGKKNNLKALLSKSSTQAKNNNSGSGGLGDFLSSL
ncbi:RNAse P Rpr2/Rpp21/SNM1 subunit domain-containing protein [Helicostylum pulchrum]|nr:RNAse P Rpr2/Rpp21/SNM1 subunit domain-containing protein [Helicostylum pulchrum]